MRFLSPLRYPGGKASLGEFVGGLIDNSWPRRGTYVEPFAGGAGVALHLLLHEHVDRVVLNDLDPGVAALWRGVFHDTTELVRRLRSCKVSIPAWRAHRARYLRGESADPDLGFSTLFLNRTNRSGILGARPIGGLEQTGTWKMDARFNREDLITRVELLSEYKNRVVLKEMDARELLLSMQSEWDDCFVYADPPYIDQGDQLYMNKMDWAAHVAFAECLRQNESTWMVTYNTDPRVPRELYPDSRCAAFGIKHTAQRQHVGKEYAVFSDAVPVERMEGAGSGTARWLPGSKAPR